MQNQKSLKIVHSLKIYIQYIHTFVCNWYDFQILKLLFDFVGNINRMPRKDHILKKMLNKIFHEKIINNILEFIVNTMDY